MLLPVEIYATTARLYYLQSEKHCKVQLDVYSHISTQFVGVYN